MDTSDRRRRVSEEAAEWWEDMQGEEARALREQYVDWLRESGLHVAEMLRVAQIHGALEQFDRWNRISTDGVGDAENAVLRLPAATRIPFAQDSSDRPKRNQLGWWGAVALCTLLVITAAVFLIFRDQVIQTERAERREVALADGSVLHVDPDTRLRIKYEARVRRVFLEHGRALFHVAKDPNRPFLVVADNTTVRAVGTAFAVESQRDSILVTVSEGKIAVFPSQVGAPPHSLPSTAVATSTSRNEVARALDQSVRPESSWGGSARQIVLIADQQVSVARSGNAEPVHPVDSSRALAWADGRLIFDNNTVGEAIGQFNRYNRIQIHVNDVELARRPISGVFDAADPESFVAFIQSVTAVRVTRSPSADITIDLLK